MGKRQSISGQVGKTQSLPVRLLLTDARNDARLERVISRLGKGDAVVFRHYHLAPPARMQRFRQLQRRAGARGVSVIAARLGRAGRVDGVYGSAREVAGAPGWKLATAHSLAEIAAAVRAGADAVLLSPVFPTRSHAGAPVLGPLRFLMMARRSPLPVIALGGMTARRAARMPVRGWAAIDGMA